MCAYASPSFGASVEDGAVKEKRTNVARVGMVGGAWDRSVGAVRR